jgi:hypothetical protein
MTFYALSLLPDGCLFDEREVAVSNLASSEVSLLADLLEKSPQHSKLELDTDIGPLVLESTRSISGALLTLWHNGRPLVSSVLLSGLDREADSTLLDRFCSSITRTAPVRELTSASAPFASFGTCMNRPFIGSVIWPVLPKEEFDQVAFIDLHFAQAFFSSLGL